MQIFDKSGVKVVTKTDKSKSAYVLNTDQLTVLESAGIRPAQGEVFILTVLQDPRRDSVSASFYLSERSEQAGRKPEPRLGREFITSWLDVDDKILIGSIGSQVFALKLHQHSNEADVVRDVVKASRREAVLYRARKAVGRPGTRTVERQEFIRDPFVVRGVLLRADGKCERPGCARDLFVRDDENIYLEVHHVVPLAEGGDDTLENAAALCPSCHREMHHGKERAALRKLLRAYVSSVIP